MGFGIDISQVEDVELRSVLERASALVDAYCAVPNLPQKHDFRGGAITSERHTWRLGTDLMPLGPGSRRVYLFHPPIKSISAFTVKFTNQYGVTIAPTNLYINEIEGWAEVVSLAAVVSGLYPVGINFGLYTPVAEVDYSYGYSFAVTGEPLYPTDALTYQGNNGYWAATPAPVIYKNGTALTVSTDYTVNRTEGHVKLVSTISATDEITADYTYTLPSAVAQATGITAWHLLGDRAIAKKGWTGLQAIQIAEVKIDRRMGRSVGSAATATEVVPDQAQGLLSPFVFRSVG
jgi:hypothetical protein